MRSTKQPLALFLIACFAFSLPGIPGNHAHAEDVKKIVFISGKPSHGTMSHEHRAGNLLLAKRLRAAKLGVEVVVLPEDGYPKDPTVLKDAASIVIFSTGGPMHMLNKRLEEFDHLMKAGIGVVMIHWATETVNGPPSEKFLSWMGGHCALNWSVNPHWTPHFDALPVHPITRGVKPFKLNDEWYYHMRFVEEMKGVTPILSDLPGPETLKRADGERSGNPTVRKKVAAGESMHVAWAYERPDGKGRGFGFTGGHNHISWKDDSFRTIMLNAILWTAKVDVPAGGVPSTTPSDEEIKQNLDSDRKRGKKKPPVIKTSRNGALDLNLVSADQTREMTLSDSLNLLTRAAHKEQNPKARKALIKGMLLGLKGKRNVPAPQNWQNVSSRLAAGEDQELRNLILNLNQIFGDENATRAALATVQNRGESIEARRQALASLLTQQRKELLPILEKLLDEKALQIEAIRGYSTFEAAHAPTLMLERYPNFPPAAQRAVIETLVTRKAYAEALFTALEKGRISPEAIPAYVSRSLSGILGEKFTRKYERKSLSQNKESLIAKYTKMAGANALARADAGQGRMVYQKTCMACHKMYNEGGIIGPDLTGSNRADLNYLLLNIIDPSGDIADAYKLVTVHTKGGQVLAGTVTAEDDQKLELSMVGQKNTIAKSDILKRTVAPGSMMPEGLLETLKPSEVLHLFNYLQTKTQVELP
jgi:putative heme-binding domain-containing protein